jgi:hypothetical protein
MNIQRTFVCLLAALGLSCCAAKKEEGPAGETVKADGFPAGLTLSFEPADRMVKPGKKVRMWVENKTGESFAWEWIGQGTCGEFQFNKEKSFEAILVGGEYAEDCREEITFKATGGGQVHEKKINVMVKGNPKFASLAVRPDPIPDSWVLINNYDRTMAGREVKCVTEIGGKTKKPSVGLAFDTKGSKKASRSAEERKKAEEAAAKTGVVQKVEEVFEGITLNMLDSPFLPWKFEFGICDFAEVPEDDEGALAISYDLPHDDDYCGYFEHLKLGQDCEAEPFDSSIFEKLTFIVKSGDGEPHEVYAEMVAWEKFAEFHQGRTEPVGPFKVPADKWVRYEVPLVDLYKDTLIPDSIKSVSFKVVRQNQADTGVILFDNIAFIKKGSAE